MKPRQSKGNMTRASRAPDLGEKQTTAHFSTTPHWDQVYMNTYSCMNKPSFLESSWCQLSTIDALRFLQIYKHRAVHPCPVTTLGLLALSSVVRKPGGWFFQEVALSPVLVVQR